MSIIISPFVDLLRSAKCTQLSWSRIDISSFVGAKRSPENCDSIGDYTNTGKRHCSSKTKESTSSSKIVCTDVINRQKIGTTVKYNVFALGALVDDIITAANTECKGGGDCTLLEQYSIAYLQSKLKSTGNPGDKKDIYLRCVYSVLCLSYRDNDNKVKQEKVSWCLLRRLCLNVLGIVSKKLCILGYFVKQVTVMLS